MTYHSFLHRLAVPVTLCLIAASGSFASTVTVDFAQKQASSDSDAFTARMLKSVDDQMDLYVFSNRPQPQDFTLKVNGLKPGDQDIYINGQYKGKKPASELAGGVKLTVPGRVVNPVLFRCADSLKARIDSEISYIEQDKDAEHVRVLYTLRQASNWVKSAAQADKSSRSVEIVVAPAGTVLAARPSMSFKSPEEAAQIYSNICKTLQQARDRMYDNITFGVLRNDAVVALTPVDLKLTYSVVNGKAKGTAVVTNNSDLPISGKITPAVPEGWKLSASNFVFDNLGSGQTFKVDFALTPPKPGVALPATLKTEAAAKLSYGPYMAKLILSAEAVKGGTVTVPVIRAPQPAPTTPSTSTVPVKPPVVVPAINPTGGSAVE